MEKEIKIYHVETQEDYDDLMIKLEKEGCMWASGDKPTSENYWHICEKETVIYLGSWRKGEMTKGDLSEAKYDYPTIPIIKHKAKGVEQMEKVVVPKFVVDWYDNYRYKSLRLVLNHLMNCRDECIMEWVDKNSPSSAQGIIAKMHLFQDYEVEEKKYYWRKKKEHILEFETVEFTYLNYRHIPERLFFSGLTQNENHKTKFTETEVRELVSKEDFNKLERVEIDDV